MSKKLLFLAVFSGFVLFGTGSASAIYFNNYVLPDKASAHIYAGALDSEQIQLVKFEDKVGTTSTTCYVAYSDKPGVANTTNRSLSMSCVK